MAPIAISNQRPGFVPFSAAPLRISGRPVFAGYQGLSPAPYRPAAYKPPMLSNPAPRLGQGFSFTGIPMSLTFGIAGAAAMVLAGVVPSPAKELATVAGLGLIAFGILNLFSAPVAANTTTPAGGAAPFQAPSTDQFNLVTAKITKPSLGEAINRGAFSNDYDIEVLWTNNSEKSVSVPYRIYVEETPEGITSFAASEFKGVAYTGMVNLGPHQAVVVPLEIDLQFRGVNLAGATAILLKVQKISSSNQVFDADRKSFVVY